MVEDYRISCDRSEMNLDIIHSFISKSYWADGIPINIMEKAIENSMCFGVFTIGGEQVGFARMITDYATYAYMADVFISEPHRGKGLSKWLIKTISEHPSLQGLRRITLATKDAHGLYSHYGYEPLADPDIFMEKWNPNVYKKA